MRCAVSHLGAPCEPLFFGLRSPPMKKDLPGWAQMRWYDWLLMVCFLIVVALAWTDLADWLGIETWAR